MSSAPPSAVRRQSQRPEVSYRQRQLEPGDVTITHGLPVTTIERTVTDLVEARTDLSLVADVVRDAAQTRRLDTNRLKELLGPLAARNGLRKGDGAALLDETPKVGVNGFRGMSHRMASRWISLDVVRFVRDR